MSKDKAPFSWEDPFQLREQFSEEERLILESARNYAQDKLLPRVQLAFREEVFDREIMNEFGALGMLGATLPEKYGCANSNYVSYGIMAREVERVDSGYRSAMSVQSSLVMHPIHAYGDEAQKDQCRKQKRRLHFVANVLVVSDPTHPENEGKVMLLSLIHI